MNYICLVCGYAGLEEMFSDGVRFFSTHEICPSCGFHYGYDDLNGSGEYPDGFDEFEIMNSYRKKWIDSGARWWSRSTSQPNGWSSEEQLKNISPSV